MTRTGGPCDAALAEYTAANFNTGSGGSHSHTVDSHNHGMSHHHNISGHKHSVDSHSHGLNSHTHTLGSHTHEVGSHTHSIGSHWHSVDSHSPEWTITTGSPPTTTLSAPGPPGPAARP